jgi:hypothetical protein
MMLISDMGSKIRAKIQLVSPFQSKVRLAPNPNSKKIEFKMQ